MKSKMKRLFKEMVDNPEIEAPAVVQRETGPINYTKHFARAGRSNEKGITEDAVDQNQLMMGIDVEFEHTTHRDIAKKIALDHLAEIPDYYTRLRNMEDEARMKKTEVKESLESDALHGRVTDINAKISNYEKRIKSLQDDAQPENEKEIQRKINFLKNRIAELKKLKSKYGA
jgi:hypothetical protein